MWKCKKIAHPFSDGAQNTFLRSLCSTVTVIARKQRQIQNIRYKMFGQIFQSVESKNFVKIKIRRVPSDGLYGVQRAMTVRTKIKLTLKTLREQCRNQFFHYYNQFSGWFRSIGEHFCRFRNHLYPTICVTEPYSESNEFFNIFFFFSNAYTQCVP